MAARRDVRYQVQCPVVFVVDGKPGQGTFNLSRGGCAIDTDMYAAIDDPVSLHITVSNQPTPVSIVLGNVRWASRRVLGVEFIFLDVGCLVIVFYFLFLFGF